MSQGVSSIHTSPVMNVYREKKMLIFRPFPRERSQKLYYKYYINILNNVDS